MVPRRQFVTKHNWNRYDAGFDSRNETYEAYNDRLIKHEFFGYKIFGLVTNTPEHVYISKDVRQNLQLNVELLQKSQSLRDYLGIERRKKIDTYSPSEKDVIAGRLQQLNGIGVQCFVGMVVGDFDLFGVGLDNVRVQGNKAFKIDPSDIKLPFSDNTTTEAKSYSAALPRLLTTLQQDNDFMTHEQKFGGMPYFNFLFPLLSQQQKEQGIRAMYSLLLPEAESQLAQFAERLGYDNTVIKALQENARAILAAFDPEKKFENDPLPLNDIQQDVLFRDEQHFSPTDEIIESGNSRPVVSNKTYSEKHERLKILTDCQGELYNLIKALRQKQQTLSEDSTKQTKASTLATPLKNLELLHSTMAQLLTQEKVSREELRAIYKTFDKISKDLLTELKKDPTESGNVNKLIRNLSDTFKLLPKALGAEMQSSTIQMTEKTQKVFYHSHAGFFQDVANDKPPERFTNNNAGTNVKAKKTEGGNNNNQPPRP